MSLSESLSVRDEAIVAILAEGKTATQAAAELGVGNATVFRALARPDVRAAVAIARAGHWATDATLLKAEYRRSVDVLLTIRDDPDTPQALRVKVSLAVCELAMALHKVCDEEERLTALEQFAADHVRGQQPGRN